MVYIPHVGSWCHEFSIEENATTYKKGPIKSWKLAQLTMCQTQYGPVLNKHNFPQVQGYQTDPGHSRTEHSMEGSQLITETIRGTGSSPGHFICIPPPPISV